jgi:ABC-type antimicrobial peptide transport system permease subunit
VKLALAGTAAGSVAALATCSWMMRTQSSVRALAPAALIVRMASLAACLIPAVRAARIDPAVALRQD